MNCGKCVLNARAKLKEGDDKLILPCYISRTTPRGCLAPVAHAMHAELSVWVEVLYMIGSETPIAQALPFLDRIGATPSDWDVIRQMQSAAAEAREEKRERDKKQPK